VKLWRLAWRNLGRTKRRNLATAMAIAVGCAGLVILGWWATRVEAFLRSGSVYLDHRGHVLVYKEGGLERAAGRPARYSFSPAEQAAILAAVRDDARVDFAGRYLRGMGLAGNGCRTTPFIALGIEPAIEARALRHPAVVENNADFAQPVKGSLVSERADVAGAVGVSAGLARLLGKRRIHDEVAAAGRGVGLVVPDCASDDAPAIIAADANIQLAGMTFDGALSAIDGEIVNIFHAASSQAEDMTLVTSLATLQDLYATDATTYIAIYLKDWRQAGAMSVELQDRLRAAGLAASVYPFTDERVNSFYADRVRAHARDRNVSRARLHSAPGGRHLPPRGRPAGDRQHRGRDRRGGAVRLGGQRRQHPLQPTRRARHGAGPAVAVLAGRARRRGPSRAPHHPGDLRRSPSARRAAHRRPADGHDRVMHMKKASGFGLQASAPAGCWPGLETRRTRVAVTHLVLVVAALMALAARPAAQVPSPDQLLKDADRARGGLGSGITWNVTVETSEEGSTTSRTLIVKARGDDALVETLAPPRHKGEIMLFNDRTIWFIKPGLRRPVSISARQRFVGDAANGDIATTKYARDYDGVIAGEEAVNGEASYLLELKARARNVTYDRIRYWISKKRHLGLKAEFLTVGGDLFKTATFDYGNRLRSAGADFEFVSRMVIMDATGVGSSTVITFGAPKAETHAPSLFNINNVVR
jgi:hypothetical protein